MTLQGLLDVCLESAVPSSDKTQQKLPISRKICASEECGNARHVVLGPKHVRADLEMPAYITEVIGHDRGDLKKPVHADRATSMPFARYRVQVNRHWLPSYVP